MGRWLCVLSLSRCTNRYLAICTRAVTTTGERPRWRTVRWWLSHLCTVSLANEGRQARVHAHEHTHTHTHRHCTDIIITPSLLRTGYNQPPPQQQYYSQQQQPTAAYSQPAAYGGAGYQQQQHQQQQHDSYDMQPMNGGSRRNMNDMQTFFAEVRALPSAAPSQGPMHCHLFITDYLTRTFSVPG